MGKHGKDYNNTPVDPNATGNQKADQFDEQFASNQREQSTHPALDNYEAKRDGKK